MLQMANGQTSTRVSLSESDQMFRSLTQSGALLVRSLFQLLATLPHAEFTSRSMAVAATLTQWLTALSLLLSHLQTTSSLSTPTQSVGAYLRLVKSCSPTTRTTHSMFRQRMT